jgi:hypothetical protein
LKCAPLAANVRTVHATDAPPRRTIALTFVVLLAAPLVAETPPTWGRRMAESTLAEHPEL